MGERHTGAAHGDRLTPEHVRVPSGGAWRILFLDSTRDPEIAALHRRIQAEATARLAATIVAQAPPLQVLVAPTARL